MGTLGGGPRIPRIVENLGTAVEVHRHHKMSRCHPVDDSLSLRLDVHSVFYPWQERVVAVHLHVVVVVVGGMDAIFQDQIVGQMIGAIGVLERTDIKIYIVQQPLHGGIGSGVVQDIVGQAQYHVVTHHLPSVYRR